MGAIQRRPPVHKFNPVEDHQHRAFHSYGTTLKASLKSRPILAGILAIFALRRTRLEGYHFQKLSSLIVADAFEPASFRYAAFSDVLPLLLATVRFVSFTFQLVAATEDRLNATELQTVHFGSFAVPEDTALI